MINKRLGAGESIDVIKADLRDKGVDIYKFSSAEGEVDEKIDKRMNELLQERNRKWKLSKFCRRNLMLPEGIQSQQKRIKSDGTGLIIIGGVLAHYVATCCGDASEHQTLQPTDVLGNSYFSVCLDGRNKKEENMASYESRIIILSAYLILHPL